MKLKLSLALVLAAHLPVSVYAGDVLAPIASARPLYEGFRGPPLASAQRMLGEMSGTSALVPKDFVSFAGFDPALFAAFEKLPAKRTQIADFTACTEVGAPPLHNYRVTKGASSSTDYLVDGFTDKARAAIEKADSRVLHYMQVPAGADREAAGVTQYLDFNQPSKRFPSKAEGVPLRIGTLANTVVPVLSITQCAKPSAASAPFSDDLLRQAQSAGRLAHEDGTGILWTVKPSRDAGKWVAIGPANLSPANGRKLFETALSVRHAAGQQPWHMSKTETRKGSAQLQLIQFAKFDYAEGRSETLALYVAEGKARLSWTIVNGAASPLEASALPPSPPDMTGPAKTSFEDYLKPFSPRGQAALRLMQVAFECGDTPVTKGINKDLVSSRVLFESLGAARPDSQALTKMPADDFRALVVVGVEKLADIDGTDVTTTADCGVSQMQVNEWSAQLDKAQPEFVQFLKRMESLD